MKCIAPKSLTRAPSALIAFLLLAGCNGANSTGGGMAAGDSTAPAAPADANNAAVMEVHGMACPQCASNIDRQLLKVEGVEAVTIDMGSGIVTATLSSTNPPTREQLVQAIEETGFTLVSIAMPAEG